MLKGYRKHVLVDALFHEILESEAHEKKTTITSVLEGILMDYYEVSNDV